MTLTHLARVSMQRPASGALWVIDVVPCFVLDWISGQCLASACDKFIVVIISMHWLYCCNGCLAFIELLSIHTAAQIRLGIYRYWS